MTDSNNRTEKDFLGEKQIPQNALYGIHSVRARDNFPDRTPFHIEWYKALGAVKKACYLTTKDFFEKASEKISFDQTNLKSISTDTLNSMVLAAEDIEKGKWFDHFIVPAISGGAGTSINLNINEIIANLALKNLGHSPGDYSQIDPIEEANIFQSTNDVIPTSLKVAAMRLLLELEEKINATRFDLEGLEKKHNNHLRKGYTQMQEAVPSSFGRLFSTYNDALSRDWWRISKCIERIKVVNLGGSAIGSGITVPRYYSMEVARKLQETTNIPVTRGENLFDATNNLDSLVEVHGILKAHAVNLEKMVNDLRLLSSDLLGQKQLEIPKKQVGSSIMPGKVNPVVPEFVISCSHKAYSNDSTIASLSAQGCLELNAYLPIIGHALLDSLKLLIASNQTIKYNILSGIRIDHKFAERDLFLSSSITTGLVPYIGYNKASKLSGYMIENRCSVFEANKALQLIEQNKLEKVLSADKLLKAGFTIKDILETD